MAEGVRPQGAFICTLHECLDLATRSGNRIGSSTTIHALGVHLKRGFLLGMEMSRPDWEAGPRTTSPAGCFSLARWQEVPCLGRGKWTAELRLQRVSCR